MNELSQEEIRRREKAESELIALGRRAAVELETLKLADPEGAARVRGIVEGFRLESERSDVELTSLSVLSFASFGWGTGCKDEWDGFCFGTVMRKGLEWLAKQESANAWAALALTEAGGFRFKEEARKASEAIRKQRVSTSEEMAWKALVLGSAHWNDLIEGGREEAVTIACLLGPRHDAWEQAAGILSGRGLKAKNGLCGSMVTPLSPGTVRVLVLVLDIGEAEECRIGIDGSVRHRDRALKGQRSEPWDCEWGSWEGEGLRRRLARTIHHALGLAAYSYPYDVR